MKLEAGHELGQYRVLRLLGSGGMADVYEAADQILARRVALKVLPAALSRDPDLVQRFEKEVRAAASLDHAGIVTIYEVGQSGGVYYYTMRLLSGGDLRDRIREGLSEFQALGLLMEVLDAFDHAHGRGFVHRDVKPENILFDDRGRPVLTDFGIAKAMAASAKLTATGVALGTPRYISPEQAKGRNVDHRADIYSLGVILYEMLTGTRPYDGDEAFAVILKHVTEPVPRLPPALEKYQDLIDRLMAKEPDQRPSSCRELQSLIEPYLPAPGGAAQGRSRFGLPSVQETGRQMSAATQLMSEQAIRRFMANAEQQRRDTASRRSSANTGASSWPERGTQTPDMPTVRTADGRRAPAARDPGYTASSGILSDAPPADSNGSAGLSWWRRWLFPDASARQRRAALRYLKEQERRREQLLADPSPSMRSSAPQIDSAGSGPAGVRTSQRGRGGWPSTPGSDSPPGFGAGAEPAAPSARQLTDETLISTPLDAPAGYPVSVPPKDPAVTGGSAAISSGLPVVSEPIRMRDSTMATPVPEQTAAAPGRFAEAEIRGSLAVAVPTSTTGAAAPSVMVDSVPRQPWVRYAAIAAILAICLAAALALWPDALGPEKEPSAPSTPADRSEAAPAGPAQAPVSTEATAPADEAGRLEQQRQEAERQQRERQAEQEAVRQREEQAERARREQEAVEAERRREQAERQATIEAEQQLRQEAERQQLERQAAEAQRRQQEAERQQRERQAEQEAARQRQEQAERERREQKAAEAKRRREQAERQRDERDATARETEAERQRQEAEARRRKDEEKIFRPFGM